MEKRVDLKKVLFSIILIIGLFSLTGAYGAVAPKIAAGKRHTVALKTDGTLQGWGINGNGQLGDGTSVDKNAPVPIGPDYDWSQIAAGAYHTEALKTDGSLWTWGSNYYGQVGDGTIPYRKSPFRVFSLGTPSLYLTAPSNGQGITGCSYYDLPTFRWFTEETFKTLEIQFSLDQSFSSIRVRVKASATVTEIQMKSSSRRSRYSGERASMSTTGRPFEGPKRWSADSLLLPRLMGGEIVA